MKSRACPDALVPLRCGCATLRRASRAVTRLYGAALRPTGLRATQFTLLQALDAVGEIRQADLGEILAIDSTTLSRTLKPLVDAAWIEGSRGGDRRELLFRLTSPGREKLKSARARWRVAQDRLQKSMGNAGWTGFLDALNRTAHAAQRIRL